MSVSQKVAESGLARRKRARRFPDRFREMKDEMRKVSWTTKEELVSHTKVVVGAVFVLGIGMYVVDLVIRFLLEGIAGMVRSIG